MSSEYWRSSESSDFVIKTQSEKQLNKDVVQRIIKVTNTKEVRKHVVFLIPF